MLLNEILKEKEELLEEFVLLEAEVDLRKAVASALRSETKELTITPRIDALAEKIFNNYLNNLRQNKYENDRYANDKRGFLNVSSKDFPSKNAARYLAILEKNRPVITAAVEKAIKEKLSLPYTNDWIRNVFSDKMPKGYNPNVEIVAKRGQEEKQVEKKPSDFKPKEKEEKKGVSKKSFLLQVFDAYNREVGGKSIGMKRSWIEQHLTLELDQPNNKNTPRPKCDDIICQDGVTGFEIEYKKVTNPLQKAEDMFELGASKAILYADIMKVSDFISSVSDKEKDSFEDFFIILKNTFKSEAVRLANKTVRGKVNYLVFGTYMKGDMPYSSAAVGSDFLITDRSPQVGKGEVEKVSRWELGISRKAKNLVDMPNDFWDKLDKASIGDKLANHIIKNASDYNGKAQNRVSSGFGLETFLKKNTSRDIIYKTLLDKGFKKDEVSKVPENKLKFIFKFDGRPLFEGRMEFKFSKKSISPADNGSAIPPNVINVDFKDKKGGGELEHDHAVKMKNAPASVDTDEKINKVASELLSIKKGKKNV